MVKVKEEKTYFPPEDFLCFNHPMVKVKAKFGEIWEKALMCFNHPMVKVKVLTNDPADGGTPFQPPYGES